MKTISDYLNEHGRLLPHRPLSETQRKALDDMTSIWLKFATFKPALRDTVDICEVQVACQMVASHYPHPAHQIIAAIEGGNIPLINEFFEELSKLPTVQHKVAAIEQVRAAWAKYLLPPKVTHTAVEAMKLIEMGMLTVRDE